MLEKVKEILQENKRRHERINAKFNPITGEGAPLTRTKVTIKDFPIATQFLPDDMMNVPMVNQIVKLGTIDAFLRDIASGEDIADRPSYQQEREKVIRQFVRIRCRYDFFFWAALFVFIKPKGGGDDVRFRLNRPQRKLISAFERQRRAGRPIRVVLLKARQWGGSTATQIYMAWLQLVHKVGLNSLIVGHVKDSATEVKDMFDRMIQHYPVEMLYKIGTAYNDNEPKLVGVGKSGNIQRIPQRNCKIKIGTAEMPNSARGGDYNLVHLTEVGLWKTTEKMTPEDIVRSACSGMLYKPYTMIVYESTANGTGNFFHREYIAAKNGKSQNEALFVAWFEIEQNAVPIDNVEQFATRLYTNRNNQAADSSREEPGAYLWKLWNLGATLEAINWYIAERSKFDDHGDMASESPSDDIEAFTFSGRKVFNDEDVDKLRPSCRPPKMVGEIYGKANDGASAIENVRFRAEVNGRMKIWQDVEHDDQELVTDRYLVVVDVCKGHSEKADYAVILVLDRIWMTDGGKPAVAAQWYGHIDMNMLAWKAVQVAQYYEHALLVIESNTLETNNTRGEAEYILTLVREVYDNLYARRQSPEDIRQGKPRKYGYHTNVFTKRTIIENLKTAVREQLYTERDEGCLDEYCVYVQTDKGGFEAPAGYHDDRLMTRAIALQICFFEMELPKFVTRKSSSNSARNHKVVSEATI